MLFALVIGVACPLRAAADARMSDSYGKLPLHFEANQGQAHQDVRFLARGLGYSLYLTAGEAVLVLAKTNPVATPDAHNTKAQLKEGIRAEQSRHEQRDAQVQVEPLALRMSLVGAAPAPLVSGSEELPGKMNYFTGKDPAKWRTNVPTYAKVHYRDVYPGIDLVYYGNQRQLEYDFVVAPGADPKKIVLGFKGADKVGIDSQGDLVLHAPGGAIRQKKPVIYQEVDGVRQEIAGSYVRKGVKRVGFKVAAYDTSRPLIIDPIVLSYSTYLGGSSGDVGSGIVADADGNAYVTGLTGSLNFPTTSGAYQPSLSGFGEIFVTKLNPAGNALVYSTYLGGSARDVGHGIAVDADGNVYVTGYTDSSNFPITPGAFQPSYGDSVFRDDAFVTKLDPTGSALVYSSYLGGNSSDVGSGIAVDSAGNAYLTGYTASTDFPTTPGAFQPTYGGNNNYVAFVTKVNPAGSALVYSTFLGGSVHDKGLGIAVNADGNAYVFGFTASTDFPTTPEAFQPTHGGRVDAFVTRLNSEGSALVYSTYLGGSDTDAGNAIAVDAKGNAYLTGDTRSTDFPTTAGAFQPTFVGGPFDELGERVRDAFVTKLNPTGSALIYSTFLGGNGSDSGYGIAVDAAGNAYVTGTTIHIRESTDEQPEECSRCINDFPTTPGSFQPHYGGGGTDAFVTKLNPTGSALVYSTYLGGSSVDGSGSAGYRIFGIAVDAAGNVYVTGVTNSTDFPTTAGAFQPTHGGSDGGAHDVFNDAFVAKFVDDTPPSPTTTSRSEESAATYMGYWPSYGAETGTFSGGTIVASKQTAATATFTFTGTAVSWIGVRCNVCGIATVSIDGGVPATVDTFGPGEPGSLVSEPVFSASGLASDVTHTLVITVTGAGAAIPGFLTGSAHVAVDAFDVTP
jgi:hypothetical protein